MFLKKKKTLTLPLPLLGALAATRGMLGTGLGLLLSKRIAERKRRAVGWTLLAIGVASTVPIAAAVLRRR
jgi:hypothetical protein